MKKFFAYLILILTLFAAVASSITDFSAEKVNAESIVTSKLEYFELDKPLSVDRNGDKVFIAQKDTVIVYHDETYDTIDVKGGDISYVEQCGNHLLILNADKVHSINLSTDELSNALFENVSSISVCGNYFAINQEQKVRVFNLTDKENFLYEEITPDYMSGDGDIFILNSSNALALAQDLTFYYFATDNKTIQDMDAKGRQGSTFDTTFASVEQLFFDNNLNVLYFKTENLIYRYLLNDKKLELVLDLSKRKLSIKGKFCIDDNLLLYCDTDNDRVIEFDLQTLSPTGFEISFTKINLPQEFSIDYDCTPTFITVNEGDRLYNINLTSSIDKGYFLFNGYHKQDYTANYLVIKEINSTYYLISGECFALVLKEDYATNAIALTEKTQTYRYTTNSGKVYKYPQLLSEFASFKFEKHEKVEITHTLSFNGIDYAIVKNDTESGFIPTSFLIEEIYSEPDFNSFTTATTSRNATDVYTDLNFKNKTDELKRFTSVVVLEEFENGYLIKYNGEKTGYVQKDALVKRGSYTDKIVAAVILLTLSLTITAVHFELKYLYRRKKNSQSN